MPVQRHDDGAGKRRERRESQIDSLLAEHEELDRTAPAAAYDRAAEALELAIAAGDDRRALASHVAAGRTAHKLGRNDAVLTHAQAAQALARKLEAMAELAIALQLEGIALTSSGSIPRALEALWRAREIAEASEDIARLASIENSTGVAYNLIRDHPRAIEHYERCCDAAERHDLRYSLCMGLGNLGTIYLVLGDLEGAERHFRRAYDTAVLLDDHVQIAHAQANLGTVLHRQGRTEESLDHLASAHALTRSLGTSALEAYVLCDLGNLHAELNHIEEAERTLRLALSVSESADDGHRAAILTGLGSLLSSQGAVDEARGLLEQAVDVARDRGDLLQQSQTLEALALLYERSGDATRALACMREMSSTKEQAIGQLQQQALADHRMREMIEASRRAFTEANEERDRLRAETERKSLELSTLTLKLTEKSRFLGSLRRSMRELAGATDAATRRALRELERQIDGQTDDDEWRAFETLFEQVHNGFISRLSQRHPDMTPTELRVCALLKINMSSKQMAEVLGTSHRTIEHHRANIRKKLLLEEGAHLATYFAGI
jgi:tetratricopeptide (TPR) repeat protein